MRLAYLRLARACAWAAARSVDAHDDLALLYVVADVEAQLDDAPGDLRGNGDWRTASITASAEYDSSTSRISTAAFCEARRCSARRGRGLAAAGGGERCGDERGALHAAWRTPSRLSSDSNGQTA